MSVKSALILVAAAAATSLMLSSCSTPPPGDVQMYPVSPLDASAPGSAYSTPAAKRQFGAVPDLNKSDSVSGHETTSTSQPMSNSDISRIFQKTHPTKHAVEQIEHAGY
jgi:hypothetical protein